MTPKACDKYPHSVRLLVRNQLERNSETRKLARKLRHGPEHSTLYLDLPDVVDAVGDLDGKQ